MEIERSPEWQREIDPVRTWHQSPLKRDAVRRALEAPGLIVVDDTPAVEAAALTLAKILEWSMSYALATPQSAQAAKRKAADAFFDAIGLLQPMWHSPGGPPPPPLEWMKSMASWAVEQHTSPAGKGAPTDPFVHFVYPWLLAFYQNVFGRPPSPTVGGPTERFLIAIFGEMEHVLATCEFASEAVAKRVRSRWKRPPQIETLRRRIRDFKGASIEQGKEVDFFLSEFERVAAVGQRSDIH